MRQNARAMLLRSGQAYMALMADFHECIAAFLIMYVVKLFNCI